MLWKLQQNRHFARRQALEAGLETGLEAMEIAIDAMESALGQASLETGLEAMEIAMDAIKSGAKQTLG